MKTAAPPTHRAEGKARRTASELAPRPTRTRGSSVRVASLVALSLACGAAAAATVKPAPFGCDAFMRDFPADAPGYRADFERPLTINRGFGDTASGVDVRILSTDTKIDGTLKCRGDAFLRFELRANLPADAKLLADFDKLEQAALMATFRWDRGKAETIQKALAEDAGEYLRASIERGDTYNAGKVEYQQADRLDLGLIWTQTDHTFVISSQSDE